MTARQQWSQGLQWGGCAWLCYVVAHSVLDLVSPGWRTDSLNPLLARFHRELGWWPAASWLTAALWLLAAVLIAARARRARPAVALAILAQAAFGVKEAAMFEASAAPPRYETSGQRVALVLGLFVPVCMAALPLVFLRVTRPREVLARMARGRWREAWEHAGGPGVVTVAIAVLWLHAGLRDAFLSAHEGAGFVDRLDSELTGMRLFRTWWMVTAIFLVFASVTVTVTAATSARTMTARQLASQGLQWGGCAWLGYAFVHTVLDLVYPAWRSNPQGWNLLRYHLETGWPAGSWLIAALWLSAVGMVAAGARRARSAVAAAIVAQAALGLKEVTSPGDIEFTGDLSSQIALVLGLFAPVCLPALPLAFLRVERPRQVLARLALGRWREAWEQAGGPGVLMVAIAVLWLHVGLRDVLECVHVRADLWMQIVFAYRALVDSGMWIVTALFLALAIVTVWTATFARDARCGRS